MNSRYSIKHVIIIVLFVVHLLPIWIFKFIPTQDGISHVYNAYVLKDYHKHENYKLRKIFKLNLKPFPNWTSHALLMLLMYVVPPLVCEKILLSLCIVLLPLSLFYFLDAVDKGKAIFGLLGFIYAYSFPLHMGFYNFVLSLSMYFFTLGYWWKHKDKMSLVNGVVLYMLLLGTYICHYMSYFLVVLSLSFFAFYSACFKVLGYQNEGRNSGAFNTLKVLIGKLRPLLLFLVLMLPAYLIMAAYYLNGIRAYKCSYANILDLLEYFFSMGSIVSFGSGQALIARILIYFFIVVFLLALIRRIREACTFQGEAVSSDISRETKWEQICSIAMNGRWQFLLMAGILTALYFMAPRTIGPGGSGGNWINERIHIYIFLVLLPFINVDFHRYIRRAMMGFIIVLTLWHLSSNAYAYYYLNKEMIEMTSSAGLMESHTTFTVYPNETNAPSDYLGELDYVGPFLHLPSYFCLNNGAVYLANYEALFNYFPINFKHEGYYLVKEADYVLVWHRGHDEIEEWKKILMELHKKGYVRLHSGKYNSLYRARRMKPDEDLWHGKKMLRKKADGA
ncbi:MAG: hypothetical protein KAS66_01210 [Candidatus Omnitrophica bacterium]|nr:hypothetical protein [Candidatus Omnitrophota bacterium]